MQAIFLSYASQTNQKISCKSRVFHQMKLFQYHLSLNKVVRSTPTPLHPSWQNTAPPTTEHEITMAFTDTIQLHHVASHTQGDCCCPFRPSDQHCSRNDPKQQLPRRYCHHPPFPLPSLQPHNYTHSLYAHPCFSIFLRSLSYFFRSKQTLSKIQKCRPRRQLKQFLPPVSFPNLKRKSQIGPGIQGIATLCLNC